MADWQWVVLFLLVVFVLSMRGKGGQSDAPRPTRRESWGESLNRRAAHQYDYTDPNATKIREDRQQQYQAEINNENSQW